MDQGSVVVLRRRAFQFATLPGHPDMDRDLSYSGSIPTATTSDPRPIETELTTSGKLPRLVCIIRTSFNASQRPMDQGSVLVFHLTCRHSYSTRSCPNYLILINGLNNYSYIILLTSIVK